MERAHEASVDLAKVLVKGAEFQTEKPPGARLL
jgi:hypothetical protein